MIKAIIIGGGIGGLATAAALARVGIKCEVFEQAEELREVGAGLTLWANAYRCLEQLGIAQNLLRLGSKIDSFQVRTWSGRVLSTSDFIPMERRLGVPANVVAHRGDLLRELARLTDPRRLHCNRRCVRIAESNGSVTATFADATEAAGDFLVGADGLYSAVRAHLHDDEERPRYAGYTCWRGVADLQPESLRNSGFEAWGPGARFALHPCGPGRVFWYATRNRDEGEMDSPRGRKSDVYELFQHWHSPIPQVIEATPAAEILRNDIVDRPPMRRWGEGRVTLLGDAAHPTTPNLGQGACQAIEDAVVLAECLKEIAGVEGALREYERRRRRRTAAITNHSWRLGRICQWEQPLGCWVRNVFTRCVPAALSMRMLERAITTDMPVLRQVSDES